MTIDDKDFLIDILASIGFSIKFSNPEPIEWVYGLSATIYDKDGKVYFTVTPNPNEAKYICSQIMSKVLTQAFFQKIDIFKPTFTPLKNE